MSEHELTPMERKARGMIYLSNDEDLMKLQMECLELLYDFNHTRPSEQAKRQAIMRAMFGSLGEGVYIEPPFHSNWGGRNVHVGDNVYMNFGVTMVDDETITIGEATMLGPHVVLATAAHPLQPELRSRAAQYNLPVTIGRNVWLGAGVIVLPGVSIGDNSVVGAGAVVTKDIPANSVAYGNPCRTVRQFNAHDMKYYRKDMRIDL